MKEMAVALLLLLGLLLPLANSQNFPYVSFHGQTLANHSYVDLSLVGGDDSSGSDSVQCITDLSTCCSGVQGPHCGDWRFPDGTRLLFPAHNVVFFETREAERVDLRHRNNALSPVGIYRCSIAVHTRIGYNSVRKTVYVGLYSNYGCGMLTFV